MEQLEDTWQRTQHARHEPGPQDAGQRTWTWASPGIKPMTFQLWDRVRVS